VLLTIVLNTLFSEPTAQALSAIFQELALHPEHMDKIRQELASISPTDKDALAKLSHLNAVINESMRLHPSLITGGARKTTHDGIMIGDTFIPPHTTVITPRWTISKREPLHSYPKNIQVILVHLLTKMLRGGLF
jgi:tryprostatin B 6-hydroxylase